MLEFNPNTMMAVIWIVDGKFEVEVGLGNDGKGMVRGGWLLCNPLSPLGTVTVKGHLVVLVVVTSRYLWRVDATHELINNVCAAVE
ncbi:MAG: hypothetical protein ACRC0O_14755, partial [Vibrio metschnikovii]